MKIIGVIPARLGSTRLKEKPLQNICGKLLVQRVYEQALKAGKLDQVVIACDDLQIKKACEKFGAVVSLTGKNCRSGTDRVAEIARKTQGDVFLNIQGDEPLINPVTIDQVAGIFCDKKTQMGTAAFALKNQSEALDDSVVKVIFDVNFNALYFSRALIPYQRNRVSDGTYYKHLGIYGYRREFLLKMARWPQTLLEKTESLEQLRVLENGYKIKVVITPFDSVSVDTPEDLKKVRKLIGGAK